MTPTATATPPSLSGMVAVSKGSKVKPLGYICWFSVPDRPVSIKTLKRHWLTAGLPSEPLPKDPRSLYLFKLAMRTQQGKVKLPDGTAVQTEVTDVMEDGEVSVYQISRVVRDRDQKVVDYPKAMRVTYHKTTEEISYEALIEKGSTVKRGDLMPMMAAIQDFFEQNSKMVSGRKLRGIVRDFLKDDTDEQDKKVGLSGENLRGKAGGVYFVAAKYEEELEGLSQCLARLYEHDHGVYGLSVVPLANGQSEREMIRAHYVANAVAETKSAIMDVAKLLRDDRKTAVRSDVFAHHYRRLQQLRRRDAQYSEALREEQDEVAAVMSILGKQLDKLSGATA